ncbi:MAG: 5-formyltetrahydrofolate cyclo-ligase [Burkholderiales bacterium]|nr:5-formyltetrahydrofolate cyclo-ligase [Burkholderiales bacterium]
MERDAAPSSAIAGAKAALRARVLAKRDKLSQAARSAASRRIAARIAALPAFEAARVVMAYASFGNEVDTWTLIAETLARGKRLVLPLIDRHRDALALHFVCDPDRELMANAWGIREPRPDICPPAMLAELDFIVVPGLAFDQRGGRLGYGKAYYDRLFHSLAGDGAMPFRIAGAFDLQIVDRVPMDAHDVAVPHIVTEARVIESAASV